MLGVRKAWAGGIIDGEGCIYLGWQRGGGVTYKVVVEMNHRQTVSLLQAVLGGTFRRTKRGTYQWTAVAGDAVTALRTVEPVLVTKWEQVKCLLSLAELVQSRPRGIPTPAMLRRRYQRLIDRCRRYNG